MHEDRKYERAAVALEPRFRAPATFDYVQGRCSDLSMGGMFVESDAPLASGTLLKFECPASAQLPAISGVACVRWSRPTRGAQPGGMGVKFVKLSPEAARAIRAAVESPERRRIDSAPPFQRLTSGRRADATPGPQGAQIRTPAESAEELPLWAAALLVVALAALVYAVR